MELYDLEPIELLEMVEARVEYQNTTFDLDMNKLAWQTSIILNGMGTMKKKVKPIDLYNPDSAKEPQSGIKVIDEDEHKKLQAELLNTFDS